MIDIINTNDFWWKLIEPYLGPGIVLLIAIIMFSYLISVNKKRGGIAIGIGLLIAAIVWLVVNTHS